MYIFLFNNNNKRIIPTKCEMLHQMHIRITNEYFLLFLYKNILKYKTYFYIVQNVNTFSVIVILLLQDTESFYRLLKTKNYIKKYTYPLVLIFLK